jgi:hypothetical protein
MIWKWELCFFWSTTKKAFKHSTEKRLKGTKSLPSLPSFCKEDGDNMGKSTREELNANTWSSHGVFLLCSRNA